MTTDRIMAVNGAIITAITGDGILDGTIGATAFGNQTTTIHGIILIVITAATTTMGIIILDTIALEEDLIRTLTDKEDQHIETQA